MVTRLHVPTHWPSDYSMTIRQPYIEAISPLQPHHLSTSSFTSPWPDYETLPLRTQQPAPLSLRRPSAQEAYLHLLHDILNRAELNLLDEVSHQSPISTPVSPEVRFINASNRPQPPLASTFRTPISDALSPISPLLLENERGTSILQLEELGIHEDHEDDDKSAVGDIAVREADIETQMTNMSMAPLLPIRSVESSRVKRSGRRTETGRHRDRGLGQPNFMDRLMTKERRRRRVGRALEGD